MSIFDKGRGRDRGGCPVCGAKRTIQVSVVARQLNENGQTAKGMRIVSKNVSLCSEHGESIYLTLADNLDTAKVTV